MAFEATNDLALVLERLRMLDAKFEGGDHAVVSGWWLVVRVAGTFSLKAPHLI